MLLAGPLEDGTCFYIPTEKDFVAGIIMGVCWVHENTGMQQEPSSKKVIQLPGEEICITLDDFSLPQQTLKKDPHLS